MSLQNRGRSVLRLALIGAIAALPHVATAQGAPAPKTLGDLVKEFDKLLPSPPKLPDFELQLQKDTFDHTRFYYRAQALAAMYEATGYERYVQELDALVQLALKYRDDSSGPAFGFPRKDELRNIPSRSWRKLNALLGRRFASVGDAAMVAAPMAHLYWILSKDRTKLLPLGLSDPAKLYDRILETIEDLDRDLSIAPNPYDRHYLYTPTPDVDKVVCATDACNDEKAKAFKPMAYNVEFLMGLALVYVNNVKQSSVLHRRIAGMTRHFFAPGNVVDQPLADGSVATWFRRADWLAQPEDPGHLNYTLDFFKSAADYQKRVPDFAKALPLMPSYDIPERLARAASGLATRVAPNWPVGQQIPGQEYAYKCGTLPIGAESGMPIFHVYLDGSRPDCMPERLLGACKEMMVMSVTDPALGAVCASLMQRSSGRSMTGIAYQARALTNR